VAIAKDGIIRNVKQKRRGLEKSGALLEYETLEEVGWQHNATLLPSRILPGFLFLGWIIILFARPR
jgi:hypothetical protein